MSQPDRIEVQCAQEAQIYMKSSMAAHFLFGVPGAAGDEGSLLSMNDKDALMRMHEPCSVRGTQFNTTAISLRWNADRSKCRVCVSGDRSLNGRPVATEFLHLGWMLSDDGSASLILRHLEEEAA
ncbi:MAG: hypothetical protein JKP96_01335 [Oceanicaulis sp.]|jgi:hypothetical protein|nr:hypothetical protein [Oceanicaulis sp.]